MDAVERFQELFAGRSDAFGTVEGACVKRAPTPQDWFDHLYGDGSIGIYPLRQDGKVKWGCSDIDLGEDLFVLAKNLHKALTKLGMLPWIERSKGKGFHVWVFSSEWIEAITMRNALLVAHEIAGVPSTEVNPKQTSLEGLSFGNYVNTPYARRWACEHKRVILNPSNDWEPYLLYSWIEEDLLTDPFTIKRAADLYVEPPPVEAVAIAKYAGGIDELVKRLKGLAFTIFSDGPLPNGDRSTTLARLAHLCREDGLNPGEALEVIRDADLRWGKMSQRKDADLQLAKLVNNAYR